MTSKVVVVDDSAFMRSEIRKILDQDPKLKVIATAENGLDAIRMVKTYKPDAVTMDINMPVMDGITSLKHIMNEAPCPVVMVSALTHESADETIEALALGAFDFFQKPSGSISLDISDQADIIRQKVRAAALSKPGRFRTNNPWNRVVAKIPAIDKLRQAITIPSDSRIAGPGNIVGVGVSTGGPKTLMAILPKIPADFMGAIVIAQHMPEKFTLSFAKRLDATCAIRVKEAKDGEILQKGRIYIAPGGRHTKIVLKDNKFCAIEIVKEKVNSVFVPSVDILFRSMLECLGNRWLGVMLTGMGSDGAQALSNLRKLGGRTIAESEESCVIFGMPRRVIELEGAEFTLHENVIADKIVELIGNALCH